MIYIEILQSNNDSEAAILQFIKVCEEWIGEADIKIAIENTDGFREYEKGAIESMLNFHIHDGSENPPKNLSFIKQNKMQRGLYVRYIKMIFNDL